MVAKIRRVVGCIKYEGVKIAMKILHVAVFTPMSTNVCQADGFEYLGHEVIRYDYRAKAKRYGSIGRDDHLITICRNEKPDIILFSKCNNMHVSVVEECGKIGTTVLWYMDNFRNINEELKQKMGKCDYIFCATSAGINEALNYNDDVHRLHGGYDSRIHCPMEVPKTRDVCFIGEIYPYRAKFIRAINCEVIKGVYNEDHARIVSETKINLNFTEGDGVSNRIYKILAAKGFLLTTPWLEMEYDFTPGDDFVVFSTIDDLKSIIGYYLNNEVERERIADHGYRTIKQYDHINYAKKIMEVVKC
jgi:spore maturation protein CgeB